MSRAPGARQHSNTVNVKNPGGRFRLRKAFRRIRQTAPIRNKDDPGIMGQPARGMAL
jgi:hypothetical protein